MIDVTELKRQAAVRAVDFVASGMVVGLGTGSTAVHMVREIGARLANGRLHNILGIPTSNATAQTAQEVGLPLTSFDQHPHIDLTIDGADEIDPQLNLIKGLGGALLREKIVAAVSRQMIIISDDSKQVARLGTRAPVPVEVIPFARQPVQAFLETLGARVVLREQNGQPFITDENNIILDCHFATGIAAATKLAHAIKQQPGVVEHGLFLNFATRAIIATPTGIIELTQFVAAV